jgi:nucleotide-binding universal stress UspA family protein
MYKKLLIANDGSPSAAVALSTAIWLTKRFDAELHMICVQELPQFATSIDEVIEEKQEGDHLLQPVATRAEAQAVAEGLKLRTHVVVGHVVATIVDFVEREGFDLLIVGFMGHSSLYNRLIGSTSDRLVELAPCAVIVVK